MEAVKTMIYDQDLPMHLWEEAARTVVYVHNRISHSALGFKIYEELYIGKKIEVSHLIYLVVQYMCIFRKRIEPIWILQKRRGYLLDTVKSTKP